MKHRIIRIAFFILSCIHFIPTFAKPTDASLFDKAVKLLQKEKYRKANEILTKIINETTDKRLLTLSYKYRSYSDLGLCDFKNTMQDFNKSISLDPSHAYTYEGIGKTKKYVDSLVEVDALFREVLTKDSLGKYSLAAQYYLGLIPNMINHDPEGKLDGIWVTFTERNIDYSDTIMIDVIGDQNIKLKCLSNSKSLELSTYNTNFIFEETLFDGKNFTVRLENRNSYKHKFYVYIFFTLSKDKKTLQGKAVNKHCAYNIIKWVKQ